MYTATLMNSYASIEQIIISHQGKAAFLFGNCAKLVHPLKKTASKLCSRTYMRLTPQLDSRVITLSKTNSDALCKQALLTHLSTNMQPIKELATCDAYTMTSPHDQKQKAAFTLRLQYRTKSLKLNYVSRLYKF